MKKHYLPVLLICTLLFSGCDDDSDTLTVTAAPEAPATVQEEVPAQTPPQSLKDVPWAWQYTETADEERITPDHPENYVLLLRSDGGVAVRADCNRGGSAFKELEGGKIELEMFAMTKMLCPPESKGEAFLEALRHVESYRIDGDTLILTLRDHGTMFLTPLVSP